MSRVEPIGRVTEELVDRLTHALSVVELNLEIDRLGFHTPDDPCLAADNALSSISAPAADAGAGQAGYRERPAPESA